MTPMYKPKKDLSILQKRLMKEHKKHHTTKHITMMTDLMKKGFCFQQAHDLTVEAEKKEKKKNGKVHILPYPYKKSKKK